MWRKVTHSVGSPIWDSMVCLGMGHGIIDKNYIQENKFPVILVHEMDYKFNLHR